MNEKILNGQTLRQMYIAGAQRLAAHASRVDALNVFPVPDGDTGTNMNLTFRSGIEELKKNTDERVDKISAVLSRGLLLGARGNSGVILSQLFRGFAKGMTGAVLADAGQVAYAFEQGVDMAYKAVMKPVEGTILTVAREAAQAAKKAARSASVVRVMDALVEAAQKALANTPNQLPVLKEVGVVDSGGQGLVYIYEGFLAALKYAEHEDRTQSEVQPAMKESLFTGHDQMESHVIYPADIQYGYCTEFIVHLQGNQGFSEANFRHQLSGYGDSLLVVSDRDLVKVHIHAEEPGDVLTYAQQYGQLDRMKIENMRLQHEEVLKKQDMQQGVHQQKSEQVKQAKDDRVPPPSLHEGAWLAGLPESEERHKPYGLIATASGNGIAHIFKSLGVDIVIEGGQTMNPSTEEFVKAIETCGAHQIIILPNNQNIWMAAEQAAQLVDLPVEVIPSKTIPQGMSAVLAFNPEVDLERNKEKMIASLAFVKTGLVTYAVRDTKVDDRDIHKGDFMGIVDGVITTAGKDLVEVAREMLTHMVSDHDELITVIYGEDVQESTLAPFLEQLEVDYPSMEVEVHNGEQPLYAFIIAVE